LYHANRDKLDEEGDKTYKILLKKLKEYQELGFGISDAKEAIKYSVKHELPNKRFLKCQELAEKKMLPLAIEGIEKGRKIIPYSILDEKTLGDQLNTRNIEFWGDIFEKDRFTPAIKNATIWKSKTFIMDKVEHIEKIMNQYIEILDVYFKSDTLSLKKDIEVLMLESNTDTGFQLPHIKVELEERARLSDEFINVTNNSAREISEWLFSNYIETYVDKLREICTEDPMIFKSSYSKDMLRLEVGALIKRVSVPLIRAIVLWPNNNIEHCRIDAVKELTIVNPWIAIRINMEQQGLENFANVVKRIFNWNKKKGDSRESKLK